MLVMHYSYGEVIGGVKTRGIVDEAHMCDGFLLSILLRILHCKNILATSIFFFSCLKICYGDHGHLKSLQAYYLSSKNKSPR
jgi:hypothetical protein